MRLRRAEGVLLFLAPCQGGVGGLVLSPDEEAFLNNPLQAARLFPNRSEYAFGMNSKPMVPFASMKVRWETRL